MQQEEIIDNNKHYWDENADLWFGTTALPTYGVKFVSENDLHFFKDVSGTKVLEICCGSGHSLKYLADRNAAELWGVDLLSLIHIFRGSPDGSSRSLPPPEGASPIPKGRFLPDGPRRRSLNVCRSAPPLLSLRLPGRPPPPARPPPPCCG